jgi:hypothetical protein
MGEFGGELVRHSNFWPDRNHCGDYIGSARGQRIGLVNVALRTGQRLIWDRDNLKAVNSASVEQYVRPQRRPGWTL